MSTPAPTPAPETTPRPSCLLASPLPKYSRGRGGRAPRHALSPAVAQKHLTRPSGLRDAPIHAIQGVIDMRLKALSVHLLTASGAVLSMFAMLAAVEGKWSLMFLWLVVALFVDGIDGPLARRYDVTKNWPTYDGVLMDLIVDYLTYVFIPAYALFKSGLLPGWTGWLAIIAIVYGSVVYFADTRMKTKDKSFAGFPACWNMVILVLFALHPHWLVTLAVVVALTICMFTNLKFIHPTRTKRW